MPTNHGASRIGPLNLRGVSFRRVDGANGTGAQLALYRRIRD